MKYSVVVGQLTSVHGIELENTTISLGKRGWFAHYHSNWMLLDAGPVLDRYMPLFLSHLILMLLLLSWCVKRETEKQKENDNGRHKERKRETERQRQRDRQRQRERNRDSER